MIALIIIGFILLIFLIFIPINNSLFAISLKLITKEKYPTYKLRLPSFLTTLLWLLILTIISIVFLAKAPTSAINYITSIIFGSYSFLTAIKSILILILLLPLLGIIIQSFILLTVNIDYTKFKSKIFKKDYAKDQNENENKKLIFINALLCSLLIFIVVMFVVVFSYLTGLILAPTISNLITSIL